MPHAFEIHSTFYSADLTTPAFPVHQTLLLIPLDNIYVCYSCVGKHESTVGQFNLDGQTVYKFGYHVLKQTKEGKRINLKLWGALNNLVTSYANTFV